MNCAKMEYLYAKFFGFLRKNICIIQKYPPSIKSMGDIPIILK